MPEVLSVHLKPAGQFSTQVCVQIKPLGEGTHRPLLQSVFSTHGAPKVCSIGGTSASPSDGTPLSGSSNGMSRPDSASVPPVISNVPKVVSLLAGFAAVPALSSPEQAAVSQVNTARQMNKT